MAYLRRNQPPRPEVLAFLEEVREHPEDDTPRLVLADWLQDQPDEIDRARGEFLYLECLLSRPEPGPAAIRTRHRQLRAQFTEQWLGPLTRVVENWRWDRGLLHLSLDGFHCFARDLLDVLPTETYAWVNGLTLRRVTGGFINVAEQTSLLHRVQSLTFEESRFNDEAFYRLFALPALVHLRQLNLAGCQVSGHAIAYLARQPKLSNLRDLDLTRGTFGATGVEALARSESLGHLRTLRLGYNLLPDAVLHDLANGPLLAHLEHLDLRGNEACGGTGLAALVLSRGAQRLRRLELPHLHLLAETVRALAHSPYLRNLRVLNLERTNVNTHGVKHLAFAGALNALESLSLARTNLYDCGVAALGEDTTQMRLKALDVGHNHLDRGAALTLATSPVFAELRELDLEDNRLGDDGAYLLARSQGLRNLHFLDVGNNGLCDAAKALLTRRFGHNATLT